jgi:transposase
VAGRSVIAKTYYGSTTAACNAVSSQLGISREALRRWVSQAQVDAGARPGVSTAESEEVRALKAKNKRLREANEILRQASISSRGNSTRTAADLRVHRLHAGSGVRGRVGLRGAARAGLPDRREDLSRLEGRSPVPTPMRW